MDVTITLRDYRKPLHSPFTIFVKYINLRTLRCATGYNSAKMNASYHDDNRNPIY